MPKLRDILKILGIGAGSMAVGAGGDAYISSPYHGDSNVSKLDYYLSKIRTENALKRLSSRDPSRVDIPMPGGLNRVAIRRDQLNEAALPHLGFKPARIAVPERGQDQLLTYRHPLNNMHIHRHKDYWLIHKDKYTPLSMMKEKSRIQNRTLAAKDVLSGVRHVVTEGIPGEIDYGIRSLFHDPNFSDILKDNPPHRASVVPFKVQGHAKSFKNN